MKLTSIGFALLVLATGLISQQRAEAQFILQNGMFGNGGAVIGIDSHRIAGTVGQPAIGTASSSSHIASAGFWYLRILIVPQLPEISVTPAGLTFDAIAGGADPAGQTLSITNSGYGILKWSVSGDVDWLSLSPTGGECTNETDEVTVSLDGTDLTIGTYNASITISAEESSNTPQTIPVILNIASVPDGSLVVQVFYPVDLVITDPRERIISKDRATIPSATYTELELDGDGDLDDKVLILDALMGNYSIEIVPEPGADPTDTYTLSVSYGSKSAILAENVEIQYIPTEPYVIFFPQCDLEPGWNLISIPVLLSSNNIDDALESIIPDCSSVWTYEATDTGGEWKRYVRNAPKFLNTLETIHAGKGYWVLMDDSCILTLDGDEVAAGSISLKPRWNLVGYNCLTARPIGEVLPSVCSCIWTYDVREGGWKRHIMGRSDNNLERMEPGKGYWVDAITGFDWNISGSVVTGAASPPVAAFGSAGAMPLNEVKGSPSHRPGIPYTVWGNIEVNGAKITRRDSASAPAPTVLLKVDDKVQSSYRLGEVAQYGDHYVLDVPETTHSSRYIELYVQFEDTLTKAASISPGIPGGIMQLDLYVHITPKVSLLHQNYPNPFNPDTWIPYQLKDDAHVAVRIYTSAGQLMRTLSLGHKAAGFYTGKENAAYWDGRNEAGENVASGVYFYSIKAGDFSATRKMVVRK